MLTADDFVTSFHRRVFEAIMALETSDGGYEFALLGDEFSPEEMGRLTKLEQERRALTENGTSVLRAAIETLRVEKARKAVRETSGIDGIRLILEGKRKKGSSNGEKPAN